MYELTDLHETRLTRVTDVLRATGAKRVLDLGCGVGLLLQCLLRETQFSELVGLEQCPDALAECRGTLASMPESAGRLTLLQGSYAESQPMLKGYDAAVMIETIEHIEPGQLTNVERTVFGELCPGVLFITTPNADFNPLYGLSPGQFRETDHKFEWSRRRFRRWASGAAERNGYQVRFGGIGEQHETLGQPTQTALFTRNPD